MKWNKWMDTLEREIEIRRDIECSSKKFVHDPNRYCRVVGGSGAASELILRESRLTSIRIDFKADHCIQDQVPGTSQVSTEQTFTQPYPSSFEGHSLCGGSHLVN